MMPQDSPPQLPPTLPRAPQPADPTKTSRSLAIALIVSAVFLLAAAGVVTWLFVRHNQPTATVQNVPADDAKDVKNVSLVPPADLPAGYVKTDQSTVTATRAYYYDTAANCGFTAGVIAAPADTAIKDAAIKMITDAQAQGITIAAQADADATNLKDAESGKDYTFDAVNMDQDVKVDGVAFTKQHNVVLYKQFGSKVAVLSYACKAEVWADKKAELAGFAQKFTVKTER